MAIELGSGDKLALLAQGLNQLEVGLTVMDADLVMVAANTRFQQLLGFPEALCRPGTTMLDALRHNAAQGEYGPGEVDELIRARAEVARQFKPHRFERTRPSDGRTLEITGMPTPDGGMVSTYLDISDRKATEQALRLERERLGNVLKGANAGSWEVNLQTGQAQINARWAELTGHTLQEMFPYSLKNLPRLFHPDDFDRARTALLHHLKDKTPYYRVEHRLKHKDGHWVWVAAHGQVASRTPDGRAEWMAGTHIDIAERKEAEQRVRELNETLEERVAERSTQLQAAMQTLHASQEALARSAAKATLGTLVASVTHELATPLGNSLITASTFTDLARRLQDQVDAGQLKRSDLARFLSEVQEGAALIERNLHRAVALVQNFKQVAADQASEQRRTFDLAGVVQEVLDTLSPSLKRHTHRVMVDVPAGITLDSFPGALGQVLINLINNAYLHAFDGRTDGTVRITAQVQNGWVEVQLADDGIGMSQELLSQFFRPFFSTKIGRGGTGLGTTIVENLVKETLGGALTVQSTLGQGTTFLVRLPLCAPQDDEMVFETHI